MAATDQWRRLRAHVTAARAAADLGDRATALAEVEAALALDPQFLLAQTLRSRLISESADASPKEHIRQPMVSPEGWLRFEERARNKRAVRRLDTARAALASGNWNAAGDALAEVREIAPGHPELPQLVAQLDRGVPRQPPPTSEAPPRREIAPGHPELPQLVARLDRGVPRQPPPTSEAPPRREIAPGHPELPQLVAQLDRGVPRQPPPTSEAPPRREIAPGHPELPQLVARLDRGVPRQPPPTSEAPPRREIAPGHPELPQLVARLDRGVPRQPPPTSEAPRRLVEPPRASLSLESRRPSLEFFDPPLNEPRASVGPRLPLRPLRPSSPHARPSRHPWRAVAAGVAGMVGIAAIVLMLLVITGGHLRSALVMTHPRITGATAPASPPPAPIKRQTAAGPPAPLPSWPLTTALATLGAAPIAGEPPETAAGTAGEADVLSPRVGPESLRTEPSLTSRQARRDGAPAIGAQALGPLQPNDVSRSSETTAAAEADRPDSANASTAADTAPRSLPTPSPSPIPPVVSARPPAPEERVARADVPSEAPPASPAIPSDVDKPPAARAASSATVEAVTNDDALVRQVLQRYRVAYGRLDARSARAVWPGVNESALARAFDGLAAQSLAFDTCDVQLRGPAATAVCRGSTRFVTKIGNGEARVEPREWTFQLRKSGTEWLIENARTAR